MQVINENTRAFNSHVELTKLQNYILNILHMNVHYILTRTVDILHKIDTKFGNMHTLTIFCSCGILMNKERLKRKEILSFTICSFLSVLSFPIKAVG